MGILIHQPFAFATDTSTEDPSEVSASQSQSDDDEDGGAEGEQSNQSEDEAQRDEPNESSIGSTTPALTPAPVVTPSAEEIESLEVRSQRRRDTESEFEGGFRIGEKMLDTFEYDDIHRILSAAPGVYYREEDGYGLRPNIGMRGVSSDRSKKIVIMEDGVLLAPAPYAAPAGYYFPLTTRLGAVEIYKGPSMLPYGPNTLGGAINLVTAPMPFDTNG